MDPRDLAQHTIKSMQGGLNSENRQELFCCNPGILLFLHKHCTELCYWLVHKR